MFCTLLIKGVPLNMNIFLIMTTIKVDNGNKSLMITKANLKAVKDATKSIGHDSQIMVSK